jgi:hypothetical protein
LKKINVTAYNTVLASWLFCSLGKCILPTTFVLSESFLASKPPRRQHPTVGSNANQAAPKMDNLFLDLVLNMKYICFNLHYSES